MYSSGKHYNYIMHGQSTQITCQRPVNHVGYITAIQICVRLKNTRGTTGSASESGHISQCQAFSVCSIRPDCLFASESRLSHFSLRVFVCLCTCVCLYPFCLPRCLLVRQQRYTHNAGAQPWQCRGGYLADNLEGFGVRRCPFPR